MLYTHHKPKPIEGAEAVSIDCECVQRRLAYLEAEIDDTDVMDVERLLTGCDFERELIWETWVYTHRGCGITREIPMNTRTINRAWLPIFLEAAHIVIAKECG